MEVAVLGVVHWCVALETGVLEEGRLLSNRGCLRKPSRGIQKLIIESSIQKNQIFLSLICALGIGEDRGAAGLLSFMDELILAVLQ